MVELECPHPSCWGKIKFDESLADGEYDCLCRSCTVRLSWQEIAPQRIPSLELIVGPSHRG